MLEDDSPSLSIDRRHALAGGVLMMALPVRGALSDEPSDPFLPRDDDEFLMVGGWVLRRDDLAPRDG